MYIISVTVGEPSPPTDLVLTLQPSWDLGVMLSWMPGFALDGEEVTFVIVSEELASEVITEFHTAELSATVNRVSDAPTCQQYRFTVFAGNGFSRSSTGVSEDRLLPAGQFHVL